MATASTNSNVLDDRQYLSQTIDRIKRKMTTIERRFLAGDLPTVTALIMAINDDTADVAAAWALLNQLAKNC